MRTIEESAWLIPYSVVPSLILEIHIDQLSLHFCLDFAIVSSLNDIFGDRSTPQDALFAPRFAWVSGWCVNFEFEKPEIPPLAWTFLAWHSKVKLVLFLWETRDRHSRLGDFDLTVVVLALNRLGSFFGLLLARGRSKGKSRHIARLFCFRTWSCCWWTCTCSEYESAAAIARNLRRRTSKCEATTSTCASSCCA